MAERYRALHVLAVLALLGALALSSVVIAPAAVQAQQGGPGRGRPQEYPPQIQVGEQRFFFDRLVDIRRQDLTEIAQENAIQIYAESDAGPFDRVYVSAPPRTEGLGRYLAEQPTDDQCAAEAAANPQFDLTVSGTTTTYAAAGPEPDLSQETLEGLTQEALGQIPTTGDGQPLLVETAEQPFPEIFIVAGELQRFVLVDEDGVPDLLSDLAFGDQQFGFAANVTGDVDPASLSRIGCAGPFPLFAPAPDAPFDDCFAVVGNQVLQFTASGDAPEVPGAAGGDAEGGNVQAGTAQETAEAEETTQAEETAVVAETPAGAETAEAEADDEETAEAGTTDTPAGEIVAPDRPQELPQELELGDARYLFDRQVSIDVTVLVELDVEVTQVEALTIYASSEEAPFALVYATAPGVAGQGRYFPEIPVVDGTASVDNPCAAEAVGGVLDLNTGGGQVRYAFANVETDLSVEALQTLTQSALGQIPTTEDGRQILVAGTDQPFSEIFLAGQDLHRYVLLDEQGLPSALEELTFAGQEFEFAEVAEDIDTAGLARIGCGGAFLLLSTQAEAPYDECYALVGQQYLRFTAVGAEPPVETAVPPTNTPAPSPTPEPTPSPTPTPSPSPTPAPTPSPTPAPTPTPTPSPTPAPTPSPTPAPTPSPTPAPTASPTPAPTAAPTAQPTAQPTAAPTAQPTASPRPPASPTPLPNVRPVIVTGASPAPAPNITVTAGLRPSPPATGPAQCPGDPGALDDDGLPERLPERIQLSGVAYSFAEQVEPADDVQFTRIGCVGPFEAVQSNQEQGAEVLYLRFRTTATVYYRFTAATSFNVTFTVTGNPQVISANNVNYVVETTWKRSIYSSITVIVYAEDPQATDPDRIFAVKVEGDVIAEYVIAGGDVVGPTDELRAAAEAAEVNPDLVLGGGQQYVLVALWTPQGTTTNGWVTLFAPGDQEQIDRYCATDPRSLDLFFYRRSGTGGDGGS